MRTLDYVEGHVHSVLPCYLHDDMPDGIVFVAFLNTVDGEERQLLIEGDHHDDLAELLNDTEAEVRAIALDAGVHYEHCQPVHRWYALDIYIAGRRSGTDAPAVVAYNVRASEFEVIDAVIQ